MLPLLELIISAGHGGEHLPTQHLGDEGKRIVSFRQFGPHSKLKNSLDCTERALTVEEEELGRWRRREENEEEEGERERGRLLSALQFLVLDP